MQDVLCADVIAAVLSHNVIASKPHQWVTRLATGEEVEGVLLTVTFYGGPLVLLGTSEGSLGTIALNGHKDLLDKISMLLIGASVRIKLIKAGGPRHRGQRYEYEVEQL